MQGKTPFERYPAIRGRAAWKRHSTGAGRRWRDPLSQRRLSTSAGPRCKEFGSSEGTANLAWLAGGARSPSAVAIPNRPLLTNLTVPACYKS
jgi:hypothetical protein